MSDASPPDQWAIVELMGHVRMAGRVTEVQQFGVTMGRIDIPDTSAEAAPAAVARSVLFSGASIYRVTYCTEEAARKVAAYEVAPPHRFELPVYTPVVSDEEEPLNSDPSEEEVAF